MLLMLNVGVEMSMERDNRQWDRGWNDPNRAINALVGLAKWLWNVLCPSGLTLRFMAMFKFVVLNLVLAAWSLGSWSLSTKIEAMQFSDYKKTLRFNLTGLNYLLNNACSHFNFRVKHRICDDLGKLFAFVSWSFAHLPWGNLHRQPIFYLDAHEPHAQQQQKQSCLIGLFQVLHWELHWSVGEHGRHGAWRWWAIS